jgi:hypothetical protein
MGKVISYIKLDETISIAEYHDGFYLYDKTRGMNIAMYAKTKDDAFFEALKYYQKRLAEYEKALAELQSKVSNFVYQFVSEVEDQVEGEYYTRLDINI